LGRFSYGRQVIDFRFRALTSADTERRAYGYVCMAPGWRYPPGSDGLGPGAGSGSRRCSRTGAVQCPVSQLCAHVLPRTLRRYAHKHRVALRRDGVATAAVEWHPQPEPDLRGPNVGDLQMRVLSSSSSAAVPTRMLAMRLPAPAPTTAAATATPVRVWWVSVSATAASPAATRWVLER
jgi:hypothetical protein